MDKDGFNLENKNFVYGFIVGVGLIFLILLMLNQPLNRLLYPVTAVDLNEQNSSEENGVAVLIRERDGVRVKISLANAPKGIPQPAHIHLGSCPNPGDIKYPLNPVLNGISETVVKGTLAQMKLAMPLAVNVHKSAIEARTYVSCGDLEIK